MDSIKEHSILQILITVRIFMKKPTSTIFFLTPVLTFGKGNGNPLQNSCLENSMDRGAWQTIVHGVARVGHNWVINTHTHTHTDFYQIKCIGRRSSLTLVFKKFPFGKLALHLLNDGTSQVVQNPPVNPGEAEDLGSIPGKIPWSRKWQPTRILAWRIP